MPPATNAAFRTWIKSLNTIKLRSDAAVVHIAYEVITNFASLTDVDKKIVESRTTTCNEKIHAIIYDPSAGITSEPSVPGAKISSIAIRRLIVEVQAAR